MHRFFLPPNDFLQDSPVLKGPEAHHCLDVLRLRKGDRLVVFDGQGSEATATIKAVGKGEVELNSLLRSLTPRVPLELTLAQAIPKAKSLDWIIQKAAELGAACVAPLLSERTVIQIDSNTAVKKQSKWENIAIEACKQCGQNWVPRILLPSSPKNFLESLEPQDLLLIASLQPDARRLKEVLAAYEREQGILPSRVTILVGPEGDFTPAELALAKSLGCHPITLGPIILRTDTAALYCLSILSHELNGS
ncbi:MAG: 16S rRNA (uracil(1498)-N(3))-methyltransferase [Verrucomicrobia bacterium]|nr:MAG: 16S rRNA (uracil(1498)-N(3))-methyltransferase [Verrucomicrobiota bacterium]